MRKTECISESEISDLSCGKVRSTRIVSGALLLAVVIILSIVSLGTGSFGLTPVDIFSIIRDSSADPVASHIFYNIRLPRMLAAVVAGASLGIAGLIMQSVLENPLASPFTTGVSQGAMFGAAFGIIFLGGASVNAAGTEVWINSLPLVAISAFLGSLITVGMIIMLTSVINIKSESIILAGIAISSFFAALTMLLQYFATDTEVAASVVWSFGDISKAGYREVVVTLIVLIPSLVYFMLRSWSYTCLLWGDEVARGLGIRTTRFRMISLIVASVIVAVPVSFIGIIGFIGLMAPHMVKLFISGDNRFLIPYSGLAGSGLLLLSDILSRIIISDIELPVGIMTSLAGVPFFIYLLLKKHGRRG